MTQATLYQKIARVLLVLGWGFALIACTLPQTKNAAPPTTTPEVVPTQIQQIGKGYQVQPGDRLFISVWREETLQREVIVPPDGRIRFPLAGEIDITRLSLAQIEQRLKNKLQEYIPDPSVSVSLIQSTGNRIYVVGKVNDPGEYILSRNIDVIQALALAGGMTPFAQKESISIIRVRNGSQQVSRFNYREVESGRRLSQNIQLIPGDTVVVP